jgi:hypothetical protein
MNIIQAIHPPSMDSSGPSRASVWLSEAMDLVHRVDARLRLKPSPATRPVAPVMRFGRRVLSDKTCLSLAGFTDFVDA